MFVADGTNRNPVNLGNNGLGDDNQASILSSRNNTKVLSTDNLSGKTSSSSDYLFPDLIIENANNPTRAIAGEEIKFSYTEKNIGNADAGAHYVGFYLSKDAKWDSNDTLLSTNSFLKVDGLTAGDSKTQELSFIVDKHIASGDYFLLYVADDYSEVTENIDEQSRNEINNNVVAKRIGIKSASPDLVIRSGDAPGTVKAGEQIQLSYQEENIGKGDANEHKVGFYLSKDEQLDNQDKRLGEDTVKSLYPDNFVRRSKTFNLDSNLETGDYYLIYVSDDNKQIKESNEDNNRFVAKRIRIEGKSTDNQNQDELNSAASLPINEQNSAAREIVKQDNTPDLVLAVKDDEAPQRAKAGSEIKLIYNEKNLGSGDAGDHKVSFYLSQDDKWDSNDIFLGDDAVSPLSAGDSVSNTKKVSLDSNLNSGDYYLIYVSDDKQQVNESNEDNNFVAKKITIKGKQANTNTDNWDNRQNLTQTTVL